jgi:hypothetical protein
MWGGYESKDFTTANWDPVELAKSTFPGHIGEVEEIVKSISWPDLLARTGVQWIDFVKCDIEDAEYDLFIDQDLSAIGFLIMELHYMALGPKRTRLLIQHLSSQLDFYYPQQSESFLNDWPPPDILRLVNPAYIPKFAWFSHRLFHPLTLARILKHKILS